MAAVQATQQALQPASQPKGTMKLENTDKRDTLIASEKKYQKAWADSKIFQQNAPTLEDVPFHSIGNREMHDKYPKYMATMAYPYMNGTLHAGHSFTASKLEFGVGWARMQGKRALYPQGYHCTGMPIKACADKLAREMEMFGDEFERCEVFQVQEEEAGKENGAPNGEPAVPAPVQETTREDVTKFATKKSKAAAKTNVALKYQFQIMLALGIPIQEIKLFAKPSHWLEHFPPLCQRDLTNLGCRVDWRRSFVTTDANPYYDAFVRWQMNRLKEMGKIKFGKRYTVYSPKDGQACMDHDRSAGEGVGVQEYTALKLRVKEWPEAAKSKIQGKVPEGANVYFVPATLRPETMYGQTHCFVGPNITYGIYEVKKGQEYYFISERAARNMAYQSIFPEPFKWGQWTKVAELQGSDVIGTLVHAPLSAQKDGIRILPMESVKASKGTGVVTSVPSDSPDDYATMMDLVKKAEYYKIKKEWADVDILPIIETPSYGNLTAKFLVEKMKIMSPKDAKQLAEAKDLAYKEGFYQGKMIYGNFAGKSVEEAKPLVRQQLIDAGDAFAYAEPEGLVISRSGDECVAGHLDQWFMNYGTPERSGDQKWQPSVLEHVKNEKGEGLNTFSTEVKNAFVQVLDWLAQWACARSYGLGTKLPWDQSQLVESLSDSTVYMAYYTFAHMLHKDIFGKERGSANIGAEEMTDEIWDYLFCRTDSLPEKMVGKKEALEKMRREFEYWYPLDVRISGKDLIQNHLTFCLYIHVALFKPEFWPKAFRVNGHLMLNGEKMSKSTGNFLTLADATSKFGADATRIAMADAGDGIEDANFEETVANANILRMFELRQWCEGMVHDARLLREEKGETYAEVKEGGEKIKNPDSIQRTGALMFWDEIFENELNGLVKVAGEEYEATNYKGAIKYGLYDFISARDFYREATKAAGVGMHHACVKRYIELQALMVTVVAPHWAEHVWVEVLGKKDTVQNARFPKVEATKPELDAAREYVRTTSSNITSAEGAQLKKMAKGKATSYDPKKEKRLSIFAARRYPEWQDGVIDVVRKNFQDMKLDVAGVSKAIPKAESKRAMPFVQTLKKSLESGVPAEVVFERKMAFDEVEVLGQMVAGLKQMVQKCIGVEVVVVEEGGKRGKVVVGLGLGLGEGGGNGVKEGEVRENLPQTAENAVPGQPTFFFENV
ncbi:cytosolic leucyl tRNA synthetase [Recurvomyces mirabilis]|uniref:leucine--tRNA ligase n=1 Tax=Recurvomyces mirabilis TaxID=574656 RepID=A0AAE0WH85_9PEZI|nr:cytosolic leucyl tRNA synthetase [Recurvomyces mirabilis]KAK5158198.1 cytosolic leucyl tRNA synthetase [Recurvomyces mirabilis]